MAGYKYAEYLHKQDSTEYDLEHKPGTVVPHSGIYRCKHCGDEYACNRGTPFPPQNHHQHTPAAPIIWNLLVFAQVKK